MTARDHARALLESVADSHDDLTRAVAGVGWALLTDPYPRREADNTAATGHQRPANGPRSAEQADGRYLGGGPAERPSEPPRGGPMSTEPHEATNKTLQPKEGHLP